MSIKANPNLKPGKYRSSLPGEENEIISVEYEFPDLNFAAFHSDGRTYDFGFAELFPTHLQLIELES